MHFLLLLACLPLASAQFNFFDHMFGHPQHQQQQQQQQRGSGASSDNSQWMAHSDALSCSQYLCPDTLACVKRPTDCPCPNAEDIKCTVPDGVNTDGGTVVCVRGIEECGSVERLMRSYTSD